MAARNMPAAEVELTDELVRGLLADQHPDLADHPLTLVANGWDNAIFRLGEELGLRLPRRREGAALVLHEQRWLPAFARRLPLPVPAPVRVGVPGRGYPWAWSVCPWFGGDVAAECALVDQRREAEKLGSFVAALHVPAPPEAPDNSWARGFPIDQLTERVTANIATLGHERGDDMLARWSELVDTPPWDGPPLWIHGDLHTANVLVDGGAISAVIDFGDITGADPAVDLAIAWMLFDPPDRAVFRDAAGEGEFPVDDAMWRRAEAWALHFAVLYLLNSADNPRFTRMGEQLLSSLLDAPA